jgi:hypothetical protein
MRERIGTLEFVEEPAITPELIEQIEVLKRDIVLFRQDNHEDHALNKAVILAKTLEKLPIEAKLSVTAIDNEQIKTYLINSNEQVGAINQDELFKGYIVGFGLSSISSMRLFKYDSYITPQYIDVNLVDVGQKWDFDLAD